jgi:hypothetical protein
MYSCHLLSRDTDFDSALPPDAEDDLVRLGPKSVGGAQNLLVLVPPRSSWEALHDSAGGLAPDRVHHRLED